MQVPRSSWKPLSFALGAIAAVVSVAGGAAAQQRGGGPPPAPQAIAPMDYTGYWVSVVTEDWRWRMVTPPKGDAASVPINAEGRKVADAWDLAADKAAGNECKPFGAAGLMRLPLRMHITWQDDKTLKLETDTGTQTRLLRFGGPAPEGTAASLQGYSRAEWIKQAQSAGIGGPGRGPLPVAGGHLKVTTTNLRAGYLRKNGVPYSDRTVLTEYFVHHQAAGLDWLTLISIVNDPVYLNEPFITSTDFRKEADNAKWRPTGCEVDPPLK